VGRVPAVTGLTVNQALEEIAKAKYAASVEYEYATVAPGVVIAQALTAASWHQLGNRSNSLSQRD